jgi:dienelactone hydrolase
MARPRSDDSEDNIMRFGLSQRFVGFSGDGMRALDDSPPMRLFAPPSSLERSALRGFAYRWLGAAALAGLVILGAPASADELVKFTSAGRGDPIEGYVTRPKGAGPFPAVVLLHTCLGLPANRRSIGDALASWGYVALFVDDFATRGLKETCAVDFPQGVADAYGALGFLAGQPFVDPRRIAAVGFSQGADTALKIAAAPAAGAGAFKASAAFYPPCANEADATLAIPTLILVGGKDDVTPAADCAALAKRQAPGMVKLVVYPGAAHAFDLPEFGTGRQVMGMTLAYDRSAAEKSWAELRAFLARRVGR